MYVPAKWHWNMEGSDPCCAHIIDAGSQSDVLVGSSLVNMYAKLWEHQECTASISKNGEAICYVMDCIEWL